MSKREFWGKGRSRGEGVKSGVIRKIIGVLVVSTLCVGMMTACGKSKETSSGGNAEKTIIVGTGNNYEPYCYLDKNGNLSGYEYEVLKAVDELLPQYKFEYQTYDFANVLLSLDSGKIDIGAHQYELNEERQKKYLFSSESYTTYTTYVTVAAGNTTVKSLDDLKGKKVKTSTGSNTTFLLEKYNDSHKDNTINLAYVNNSTNEETIAGLQNGVWDATIMTRRDAEKLNKNFGNGSSVVKQVGTPFSTSNTYFAYAKNNTELQSAIDEALKQLKSSGKLAEISKAVIGGDYTVSE